MKNIANDYEKYDNYVNYQKTSKNKNRNKWK